VLAWLKTSRLPGAFCWEYVRPPAPRRECLDHLLIYAGQHLRSVLAEYARYYNARRPHHARQQRPPSHDSDQSISVTARIRRSQAVEGLINEYRRAA